MARVIAVKKQINQFENQLMWGMLSKCDNLDKDLKAALYRVGYIKLKSTAHKSLQCLCRSPSWFYHFLIVAASCCKN